MLRDFELEFEPPRRHILHTVERGKVTTMLYQDKTLGQAGGWHRFLARLALARRSNKAADLDLASLSPHLRRDLGLWDGQSGVVVPRTSV